MFKFISQIFNVPKGQIKSQKEVLRAAQNKNREQGSFEFIMLIQNWPAIAGDHLGRNTIPLKIQNGCLTLITKHSAYAQELQFMSEAIKEKIFTFYPDLRGTITKLYFKTDPSFFTQKMDLSSPEKVVPLLEKNKKFHEFSPHHQKLRSEAMEMFGSMEDPELREMLVSLHIQQAHPDA